jgi:hypothetical protein
VAKIMDFFVPRPCYGQENIFHQKPKKEKEMGSEELQFYSSYGFPTLFAQNGEHGLLQLLR